MELTEKEKALINKNRKKEEKRNRTIEPVKMFIITAILSPIVWYGFNFIHSFLYHWNIMYSWVPESLSLGNLIFECFWQAFLGANTTYEPAPIILLIWTLVMFTGPMLVLSYLRYRSITKGWKKE